MPLWPSEFGAHKTSGYNHQRGNLFFTDTEYIQCLNECDQYLQSVIASQKHAPFARGVLYRWHGICTFHTRDNSSERMERKVQYGIDGSDLRG